jgi:hypothetical protein
MFCMFMFALTKKKRGKGLPGLDEGVGWLVEL